MIVVDRVAEERQDNWQEVRMDGNLLAGTVMSLLRMGDHPRENVPLQTMEEGFYAD
jgi:hypothetical protein